MMYLVSQYHIVGLKVRAMLMTIHLLLRLVYQS
uniref:Uncharacterized protein MANES_15G028700 n=1 Tax=Rhizophora mucronata TaxID=61149 RepID=A0A2P2KBQ2_RHIMU